MIYKHTRIGYLTISVLIAVVLIFGIILTRSGFNSSILAVMFLILVLLASTSKDPSFNSMIKKINDYKSN